MIIALGIAVIQALFPLAGAQFGIPSWVNVARAAANLQALFMIVAFGCLVYAFVHFDFSVKYVVTNSNSQLPTLYRVSAVWGGHEGSLLLWVMILSLWGLAVSLFSRSIPDLMVARVLGILGMVSIGFLLFTLLTSNPFERIPMQSDGRDLCFVIGGPDGVSDACRQRADFTLSLSQLTLPHGLARVLFAEQLYRAHSLHTGHPYHRA